MSVPRQFSSQFFILGVKEMGTNRVEGTKLQQWRGPSAFEPFESYTWDPVLAVQHRVAADISLARTQQRLNVSSARALKHARQF